MNKLPQKNKGSNAERDLVHKFWKCGWSALRVAGSGSMKYPSCDVFATNKVRKLAIECKATKDKSKYLSNEDITQLKDFSDAFIAEPWIALKFDRTEWLFVSLDDIEKSGKYNVIRKENAEKKGLKFEEIIC